MQASAEAYTYNEHGDLATASREEGLAPVRFEYEYDQAGNWVRSRQFADDSAVERSRDHLLRDRAGGERTVDLTLGGVHLHLFPVGMMLAAVAVGVAVWLVYRVLRRGWRLRARSD